MTKIIADQPAGATSDAPGPEFLPSDTSTGEDVPSAELKAQVALVKAAKDAIRDTTAEAQSALRRANDQLAEVRRREAGGWPAARRHETGLRPCA